MRTLLALATTASLLSSTVYSISMTVNNQCSYDLWPAGNGDDGNGNSDNVAFHLAPGTSTTLTLQSVWSGRFWGRTGCNFDSAGNGQCVTGDCGSGNINCSGHTSPVPTTIAELTLNDAQESYYDVSVIGGYNVPLMIIPSDTSCTQTGMTQDLNAVCPSGQQVHQNGQVTNCNSGCTAYGDDPDCCTGAYTGSNCKLTNNEKWFKQYCPYCYTYPYDDGTLACNTNTWTITFCPGSSTSSKQFDLNSINNTTNLHRHHSSLMNNYQ